MKRLLNTFGMARRAGQLYTGQDKIFEALKSGNQLVIFVTNDVSENVLRKFQAARERGTADLYKMETSRRELGLSLGITAAQAAALVRGSGFADKAVKIFSEDIKYAGQRRDANG